MLEVEEHLHDCKGRVRKVRVPVSTREVKAEWRCPRCLGSIQVFRADG